MGLLVPSVQRKFALYDARACAVGDFPRRSQEQLVQGSQAMQARLELRKVTTRNFVVM